VLGYQVNDPDGEEGDGEPHVPGKVRKLVPTVPGVLVHFGRFGVAAEHGHHTVGAPVRGLVEFARDHGFEHFLLEDGDDRAVRQVPFQILTDLDGSTTTFGGPGTRLLGLVDHEQEKNAVVLPFRADAPLLPDFIPDLADVAAPQRRNDRNDDWSSFVISEAVEFFFELTFFSTAQDIGSVINGTAWSCGNLEPRESAGGEQESTQSDQKRWPHGAR